MTKDVYPHFVGVVVLQVTAASNLSTAGTCLGPYASGGAAFCLDISTILQALADKHWMGEDHDGPQGQLSRGARLDCLKFTGLDPIAQDELHDVAEGVLVGTNIVPVVLDRYQHDVVDALL